ncbi:hypothetical protein QS713_02190 [Gleimia hominis]|uniref:Nitroreductase domain-containing protein n=1 Tax=Gleimia hominis TaxID=595468 RepID=A0ABU3I918_9ACTO|nr:hypothetical protein [Gleimia hominis]MDT3766874.1 hypothetical protein [Gleimia hominis]
MDNKRITGATLLQLRRATPKQDFVDVRKIRAKLSAGNALPTAGGFVVSPKSAAVANPWIMTLGDFEYSREKRRVELPCLGAKRIASRHSSLITTSSNKLLKDRYADWSKFCTLVTHSFLPSFEDKEHRRPYASAGGLYTVQVFMLLRKGSRWYRYHLLPISHAVECLGDIPFHEIYKYVGADGLIDPKKIDIVMGYAIIPELVISKYLLRGYKFALMEIGQMIQQATLVADSLDYGTRVYAYYDEMSAAMLWDMNPDDIWIEQLQVFASEE